MELGVRNWELVGKRAETMEDINSFPFQQDSISKPVGKGAETMEDTNSQISAESRKGSIKDFTELRVWQLSMDLAESIYRDTQAFPSHEQFGLISQLRRAAVSVPSIIAEGHTRNQTGEYLRFLAISRGSLAEIKTQLLIAQRLGYLPATNAQNLLARTTDLLRQITSLRSAVERHASK